MQLMRPKARFSLLITRGELPCISYRGMCRPKRYGLRDFLVWKRVYTLPILVWNRVWFSRELRECINVFMVSIRHELKNKEKYIYANLFLKARSENGYRFKRSGLKTVVENDVIWSEIGSGFGEPGGTPTKNSQEFPHHQISLELETKPISATWFRFCFSRITLWGQEKPVVWPRDFTHTYIKEMSASIVCLSGRAWKMPMRHFA